MRWSRTFIHTLRHPPSDAEMASHRLMVRASLISRTGPGLYSYLPLGRRSIGKLEAIVREELVRAGSCEVTLPSVQPAELWQESGRWQEHGPELPRLVDRHGRDLCLGPTHLETTVDIVRHMVTSYRQLPVSLYCIQSGFRDEERPRFGLARSRENLSQDATSFHATDEDLERTSRAMEAAYDRVFERCGLSCTTYELGTGATDGSASLGLIALAETGEHTILSCAACGYGASLEQAETGQRQAPPPWTGPIPPVPEAVHTPDLCTVEAVAEFLAVAPSHLVKTLLFAAGDAFVAVLVRGDLEVNEAKLRQIVGCDELELASAEQIEQLTGGPQGFSGPVGLTGIRVIADPSVTRLEAAVTGANRADTHLVGVVPGRDFEPDEVRDVSLARPGDPCPRCAAPLGMTRGIDLGHVSRLGTAYSEAMSCTYLDAEGDGQPMPMGSYGLGIGRTVAAAVEQHHDEHGIIWPLELAPFEIVLVLLNSDKDEVVTTAEELYERLVEAGVDVLFDDRSERPGVKFNDMDLIGFPVRVVVGKKSLATGEVELSTRRDRERIMVPIDEVVDRVRETVNGLGSGN